MDEVKGVVARTNGSGFKLQGEEGWRNFSKYAPPEDTAMPAVGAVVVLSIDAKGFVRKAQPTGEVVQQPEQGQGWRRGGGGGGRDQKTITRLAVINSAIALLTANGGAPELAELMRVAGTLEAWATR